MRIATKSPTRALLATLVCTVMFVTVGLAGPAGATSVDHSSAVKGIAGPQKAEGTCPPNAEFPGDPGLHRKLVGLTRTRFGPAVLKLDVCYVFVGAIGGEQLTGSFTVATLAGSLRGRAEGTVGFSTTDDISLTLTVERGSFLLSHVGGTLAFTTSLDHTGDQPAPFTGTLTPDLHRT